MIKKGKLLVEPLWAGFLGSVTKEMNRRNPSGDWETPMGFESENFMDGYHVKGYYVKSRPFHAENASELFSVLRVDRILSDKRIMDKGIKIIPAIDLTRDDNMEVFELGRTGLQIRKTLPSGEEYDFFVLPKCHDGFYRDWEHDGICVGITAGRRRTE